MVKSAPRFSLQQPRPLHDERMLSALRYLLTTVIIFGLSAGSLRAQTQSPPSTTTSPTSTQSAAPATTPDPMAHSYSPAALAPFTATYDAYYQGKPAGTATMQLVRSSDHQWRIDLDIKGERGFASVLGLNIQQSTVFDVYPQLYRPLSQATVRKGLFLGKNISGTYDWNKMSAQWQGDLKKKRKQPISIQQGDMSALLMNLAVIRDSQPGKQLQYRLVDGGKAKLHAYQVSQHPEIVQVGEMSYEALRVNRVGGSNDDTMIWVANGVPTPVRILQRDEGEDGIDLRLTAYQEAQ